MGALTSKPYAFRARSWELRSIDFIDVFDGEGANVRFDVRGNQIMRVLPRFNFFLNLDWISDRTRFSYDSLSAQRLNGVSFFNRKGLTWSDSLAQLVNLFEDHRRSVNIVVGRTMDVTAVKRLNALSMFPSVEVINSYSNSLDSDFLVDCHVSSYDRLLENGDFHLLIGTNLKHEAPILNLRLRRNLTQSQVSLYTLDANADGFDSAGVDNGGGLQGFISIVEGKVELSKVFLRAANPVVWLGSGLLRRKDAINWLSAFRNLRQRCTNLSIASIHTNVTSSALLDEGLISSPLESEKIVKSSGLILNLASGDLEPLNGGSEINFSAHREYRSLIDLITFPILLPQEKPGVYTNTELRHQVVKPVMSAVQSEAKATDHVFHALAAVLDSANSDLLPLQPSTLNSTRIFSFDVTEIYSFVSKVRVNVTSLASMMLGHPYMAEAGFRLSKNLSIGAELLTNEQTNFYEPR